MGTFLSNLLSFFWHNWLVLLHLCWNSVTIRTYWHYIYLLLSLFPTCFSSHIAKAMVLHLTGPTAQSLVSSAPSTGHLSLTSASSSGLRMKYNISKIYYIYIYNIIFQKTLSSFVVCYLQGNSGYSWKNPFWNAFLMQSVVRLTVLLHHVLQILGNFLFGMPLTAWKSYASFITLCHSLVAATWINRITWLLQRQEKIHFSQV